MFIQENWKGLVIGAAVMAASAYGGPVAGKVVGYLMPKALTHISNTPISDVVAHRSPLAPPSSAPNAQKVSTPLRDRLYRATLAQVARDYGIAGRLDCRVVQK